MKDNYFITQTDLAKEVGVGKSTITKLKNAGVFDLCFEGKRLIRECAIKAYHDRPQDPTRENQREANAAKRSGESPAPKIPDEDLIEENTPKSAKKDEPIFSKDNIGDLRILLRSAKSSSQKVQIIKDFWTGKINQQKYLVESKELVEREEIIRANQTILKAFRDKSLALPSKYSPRLVGLEVVEIQAVLDEAIYELLEELSSLDDN